MKRAQPQRSNDSARFVRDGHRQALAEPEYLASVRARLRRRLAEGGPRGDRVWAVVYSVAASEEPSIRARADALDGWLGSSEPLDELAEMWPGDGTGPDLSSVLACHPHAGVYAWSFRRMFRESSETPPASRAPAS